MKLTVKQPLSFWADITSSPFSGEQVAGTVTNLTEDSSNIERIQEATLANSHTINWEILHPDTEDSYTASYASSDEDVATVNSDGVLTVVSDGDVVITVTITRASDGTSKSNSIEVRVDITTGSSIDYISNTSGSAGKAFDDSLNALISSSDPSTAKLRFSSRDTDTLSFTRNEDFWGIGLDGLSAISPYNTRSKSKRSGTALTKRHIICAAHYPLRVGNQIDFVADTSGSTTATRRTIQEVKTHPLYAGQSGSYCYDVQICLLDSDLPSDIDIMEVLPSDSADYVGQYNWISTSCVVFDQEQKGITRRQLNISDGIYSGNIIPDHWFNAENPTSMLNGFTYTPSLNNFSTPSDFVSPRLVSAGDPLYTHNESIIVGDSGAPNCFVLGSKLVLIGLNTYPTGGNYLPNLISDINQLITDVDTQAGISTGYTVTECDLSAYPTY